jgi:hypothetical protein
MWLSDEALVQIRRLGNTAKRFLFLPCTYINMTGQDLQIDLVD